MVNFKEKIDKLNELILGLDCEITCACSTASQFENSEFYIYEPTSYNNVLLFKTSKIGTFNKKDVFIDPYMHWENLRIFDKRGNVLINLSDFGFDFSL